jgi:hypothetical protein
MSRVHSKSERWMHCRINCQDLSWDYQPHQCLGTGTLLSLVEQYDAAQKVYAETMYQDAIKAHAEKVVTTKTNSSQCKNEISTAKSELMIAECNQKKRNYSKSLETTNRKMSNMADFALNQKRTKEAESKLQRDPIHPPSCRPRHACPDWIKCDKASCRKWRSVSMVLSYWTGDGMFACHMLANTNCDTLCDWCGLQKCDNACKKM